GLDTGVYDANIVVGSNDPDPADNPVIVSAQLTVGGSYICGDVNGDDLGPDVGDLMYLVQYIFQGGPPPPVMAAADVDGSGGVLDVGDIMYLVQYLFNGGPDLNCP
ncbi:MAG: hypothetical protein ABII79_01890, partial [bacterium]